MTPIRRAGHRAGRRAATTVLAPALTLVLAATLTACGSEDQTSAEDPSGGEATTSETDQSGAEQETGQATEQATAAADWLAGELEGGLLSYKSQYGPFTDHGMSIDAAIALERVGGQEKAVASISDAVAGSLGSYTEFPSGKGTHVSAGATAKALVLAQVAGADPTDFGGTDLVADLEGLVGDTGRIADSFPAKSKQDADYSNVIGQVYAARALAEAGSPEADATLDHLLDQQCEDGWFRLDLAPAGAEGDQDDDQGCDDDPKAQPDVDTTALAAVHLAAVAEEDDDAAEAVDEALAWLVDQQGEDGAIVSGPAEANANTTGLAGWAFGEAGDEEAAGAAARWLAGVQADNGAVAFDAASLERAPDGDVPASARSQWLLATAQATPALLWHSS
jgi:hypothetical protein